MNEKFQKLIEDRAFAEKLLALESAREVQALLQENGVDLTLEDIEGIRKLWNLDGAENCGELDEEALEDVAGGASLFSHDFHPGIRPPLTWRDVMDGKLHIARW